jgi:hypothetical protein
LRLVSFSFSWICYDISWAVGKEDMAPGSGFLGAVVFGVLVCRGFFCLCGSRFFVCFWFRSGWGRSSSFLLFCL